jgi:hypothetical protein
VRPTSVFHATVVERVGVKFISTAGWGFFTLVQAERPTTAQTRIGKRILFGIISLP